MVSDIIFYSAHCCVRYQNVAFNNLIQGIMKRKTQNMNQHK